MAIDTRHIETVNTNLITMSDAAVSQLRELISQQENASPDLGLRVFVYPGGCSGMSYGMAFEDQPADDDLTIEVDGVKLYNRVNYLKLRREERAAWQQFDGITLTSERAVPPGNCQVRSACPPGDRVTVRSGRGTVSASAVTFITASVVPLLSTRA